MKATFKNGQVFCASEPTETMLFNDQNIGGWVAAFSLFGVRSGTELENALGAESIRRIDFDSENGLVGALVGYDTRVSVVLSPMEGRADIQLLKRTGGKDNGGDET